MEDLETIPDDELAAKLGMTVDELKHYIVNSKERAKQRAKNRFFSDAIDLVHSMKAPADDQGSL